ncbi:hypothetical protein [Advenella mimigardefordensis]|uniref:hypothetical protein n=1 Tax=Advenella mimigardefordensis TaxID=302406 RepID=UPI00130D4B3F|nr:hypothetical protein [Advenella mimigardefordensis]
MKQYIAYFVSHGAENQLKFDTDTGQDPAEVAVDCIAEEFDLPHGDIEIIAIRENKGYV